MLVFTIRNAVLVALIQVAVIVVGVLAAGLSHKWWASPGIELPQTTDFLINYGVVLLALPVLWIAVTLWIRISMASDDLKSLVFASGFVLILGLFVAIGHAVITPWIYFDHWNFHRIPEESLLVLKKSHCV